jgi:outer membrane protein OmpA-like peptidoglycan-associated protein
MKKLIQLSTLLILLFSNTLYAQEGTITSTKTYEKSPWWFFAGINFGLLDMSTDLKARGEIDKDGFHSSLKGALNYYQDQYVLDFGLGWFYNEMSGKNSAQEVTTVSKSLFFEFVPRLIFADHFQIGPMLSLLFASDVSFSQELPGSKEQNSALFGGVSFVYEWNQKAPVFRVGLNAQKDIGIDDRSVGIYTAFFQVGFDVFNKRKPSEVQSETYTPYDGPIPRRDDVAVVTGPNSVDLVLAEDDGVYFDFDSYEVKPRVKAYLKKLANVLKDKKNTWDNLIVEGHTDNRGSKAYNMTLSLNRALAVKDTLKENGVANSKMKARGYGFSRPVDLANNERAWAKNRRVEFRFTGVNDPYGLTKKINGIKTIQN